MSEDERARYIAFKICGSVFTAAGTAILCLQDASLMSSNSLVPGLMTFAGLVLISGPRDE